MSIQTYSSIDWITEAERVRKAFGVEEPVTFKNKILRTEDGACDCSIGNKLGAYVECQPDYDYTYYCVSADWTLWESSYVCIDGKGHPFEFATKPSTSPALARALFHLNLLTPEVEQALQVTVDAHTKMEWALEYDRKYGEVSATK